MIHLKLSLTLFMSSSESSKLQRPDELPMHIRHIQYYLLLVVNEFRGFDHLLPGGRPREHLEVYLGVQFQMREREPCTVY